MIFKRSMLRDAMAPFCQFVWFGTSQLLCAPMSISQYHHLHLTSADVMGQQKKVLLAGMECGTALNLIKRGGKKPMALICDGPGKQYINEVYIKQHVHFGGKKENVTQSSQNK